MACIIAHMHEGKKYSETLIRHAAKTDDGQTCEIIERVTFECEHLPDGSWSEPCEINRRFDLRTGQRVNHLEGDRFQLDETGQLVNRLPA